MITATPRSHLDHGIAPDQLAYVLLALNYSKATVKVGPYGPFFIAEVELPEVFGVAPCALHGPVTGELPVLEAEAFYATRGKRPNKSRLCRRLKTTSRTITAIVIADEDSPGNQRIDTAFGGPLSPMEVDDPENKDKATSEKFWAQHALTPNSFEVKAEGILLARPNIELSGAVPAEAKLLAPEDRHITLIKLDKDQRKALKDRVFMDAPEVQFEDQVVEIVRPDRKAWVRFVNEAGQKALREYVDSLEISLCDYDKTRPFHVSLANLTGSRYDSVGDISPDRK